MNAVLMPNHDPGIQEGSRQKAIVALMALGYTELESHFLCLVALHSGVFFRRQFMEFAGIKSGRVATTFLSRLRQRSHCRLYPLARNASIYHLNSKVVYNAIGHPDLRFRRAHSLEYVKAKLLGFDYILRHPRYRYLATEEEKVDFFTRELKVPKSNLPHRSYTTPASKRETRRYFVDKYPLFLQANVPPTPPVVHFSFVDTGVFTSHVEFANHLKQYARLFQAVGNVRMIYIFHRSQKTRKAEETFRNFIQSGAAIQSKAGERLRYFELRLAWEDKQYNRVTGPDLAFLSQSRKMYQTPECEEMYLRWRQGEDIQQLESDLFRQTKPLRGTFTLEKINAPYELFGDVG